MTIKPPPVANTSVTDTTPGIRLQPAQESINGQWLVAWQEHLFIGTTEGVSAAYINPVNILESRNIKITAVGTAYMSRPDTNQYGVYYIDKTRTKIYFITSSEEGTRFKSIKVFDKLGFQIFNDYSIWDVRCVAGQINRVSILATKVVGGFITKAIIINLHPEHDHAITYYEIPVRVEKAIGQWYKTKKMQIEKVDLDTTGEPALAYAYWLEKESDSATKLFSIYVEDEAESQDLVNTDSEPSAINIQQEIETLPIEVATENGPSIYKKKTVSVVGSRVRNSANVTIQVSDGDSYSAIGASPVTGDVEINTRAEFDWQKTIKYTTSDSIELQFIRAELEVSDL